MPSPRARLQRSGTQRIYNASPASFSLPPSGPAAGLAGEWAALRIDHAEALSGGGLHHPPALDEAHAFGAERLEARDFGLEIVAFDVEVDAPGMIDPLDEQDGLGRVGAELAIVRVARRFGDELAAERTAPEGRRLLG